MVIGGKPKSLQIFLPKKVLISLCLGTVEACPAEGLIKTVCLAPSLSTKHPKDKIYLIKSLRFIWAKLKPRFLL